MVNGATGGAYLGQFSGITSQTIDKLVQAESAPMYLMQNQVQRVQDQGTAWGDVRSRLNNLLGKLNTLQKPETYNTKIATTTNANIVTISGDPQSTEGSHDLVVKQLATTSSLMGQRINSVNSSKDALNVSGKLILSLKYNGATDETGATVTIPGEPVSGSVDDKNKLELDIETTDSLSTIVNKINDQSKKTNLAAAVVDNHLVIKNVNAGNYSIVSDSGDVATKLGLPDGKNINGQAAIFSIDGLNTARNTNKITDVLDGATLSLTGLSQIDKTDVKSTQPTTITLKNDDSKFQGAVNDFVNQYNSLMNLIQSDLSIGTPGKDNNQVGVLSGDRDLIQLQSQLQKMVATTPSGTQKGNDGKILTPHSVGISFVDKEGTLGFDASAFQKALASDPKTVKNFFYQADIASVTGVASNESGYTTMLSKFANSYLVNSTGNNGIIASKTASFDSTIKDLNKQIDNFQDRLLVKRQQYITQFTALDNYMMQAQGQLAYFVQQTKGNANN